MNRRGFLQAILAAGAAPAFVRYDSLMKLYVPPPILYADGIHDDSPALAAFLAGRRFTDLRGVVHGKTLRDANLFLTETLALTNASGFALMNTTIVSTAQVAIRIPDGGSEALVGKVIVDSHSGRRNARPA